MANPTSQALEGGNNVIAGKVTTEQVPLVADTYYQGMPLKYEIDGSSAAGDGDTGNGTCDAITADAGVKAGDWVFTFTAALEGTLTDPDGNVVAEHLSIADGDSTSFNINGLKFTIADGGTPYVAGDSWTITIGTGGKYEYTADLSVIDAVYNGPEKVLGTAGYGFAITSGEIFEGGLVDDSGNSLTITEDERAAMRLRGFSPRKEA